LITVSLAIHLWFVNLSSAYPLFACLLQWRARKADDGETQPLGTQLIWRSLAALVAGALSGLAIAGLMWGSGDHRLFDVLPQFAHKIRWALWELLFYVLCLLAYLRLNRPRWLGWRAARIARVMLVVLASLNLIYHFPPLFSVMARIAEDPKQVTGPIGPREFRQLMAAGHTLPFMVHFALASVAVAAVSLLPSLVPQTSSETGAERDAAKRRLVAGAALAATLLQIPVGIWLLMRLEPLAQHRLMGSDLGGTLALSSSVLTAVWLMHHLATAAMGEPTLRDARRIRTGMMIVVLLMTAALRTV
jgi:hypothetical protein